MFAFLLVAFMANIHGLPVSARCFADLVSILFFFLLCALLYIIYLHFLLLIYLLLHLVL